MEKCDGTILSVYGSALIRAVTGSVVASGHLDVSFPNNLTWLTEVKVSFLQTHDGVAAQHLPSLDD